MRRTIYIYIYVVLYSFSKAFLKNSFNLIHSFCSAFCFFLFRSFVVIDFCVLYITIFLLLLELMHLYDAMHFVKKILYHQFFTTNHNI